MNSGSMFFLYGPPGSGKSTTGKILAGRLKLPFIDLDEQIAAEQGRSVAEIFAEAGEAVFRAAEADCLARVVQGGPGVIALGGGALLALRSRVLVESAGQVVCLPADLETLKARTARQAGARPLLAGGGGQLEALLERRAGHYASFKKQVDVSGLSAEQAAAEAALKLGAFHLQGMGAGYDVRVLGGGLDALGEMMRVRGLGGPTALVSDSVVGPLYGARAAAALAGSDYAVSVHTFTTGEMHKTLDSAAGLCEQFLEAGLERGSTVVALGGGVTTDLAGFAAAIYLRGVRWVAVPTSLLGMADASLGGKTGADLPQGKNLVGVFHPPALVVADPELLATLPEAELRSGLAEVVKHGVIADAELFALCARGLEALTAGDGPGEVVRRAMAVKAGFVARDPYEQGERAALNLGHTAGHALERASDYTLRHGEAVAIGMVAEARLAEQMGLAEAGLAEQIAAVCEGLGLPVKAPAGTDPEQVARWMRVDKKKAGGVVRFALPVRIGEVRTGVCVDLEKYRMEEWLR